MKNMKSGWVVTHTSNGLAREPGRVLLPRDSMLWSPICQGDGAKNHKRKTQKLMDAIEE
jgi:hypothetical protein